ncbi:hypothetical protein KXR53_31500 [Inquilinus limosus]|uniref:hypothetical protein n=1 Tax=Inquilinus limosus TaxID=171674 RepID=UPI003F184A2C
MTKLPTLQMIGHWNVEPDGDGYRIQTPGGRQKMLSDGLWSFLGRTILACDPGQMRATPTTAGRYALSSEAPVTCRLERADGVVWMVTAESRRTEGFIDLNEPAVVSVDTILHRLTVGRQDAGNPAKIDRLTISNGGKALGDKRSDLTSRYTIEGFVSPSPSGTGTITASRIVFDVGAEGVDVVGLSDSAIALVRRLAGLTGDAAQVAGDDPAIRDLQESFLASVGRASREEIRVEGLTTKVPGRTAKIGILAIGGAMSSFDRDGARVALRLDSRDLSIEPPTPYTAWLPTEGTIQITIDGMPLWTMIADEMLPGERDPAEVTRLVSESSMRVRIDAVHLAAPEASLDLRGTIASARDAVRGQTGDLQLRLTGIDGLVKALQADPQASQAAAGLSVLQVLGRQTTLPDGRSARDYDIVIDPSGKVLVNGADVQSLVPKPL